MIPVPMNTQVWLVAGVTDMRKGLPRWRPKLRRLGEDVTEELEYVPGRFIVNHILRPRMACSGCDCFTQAPLPSRPIERGRPGPGLLAHVLVNKSQGTVAPVGRVSPADADHLPLYRQSQIFDREGVANDARTGGAPLATLDRSTLADVNRHAILTPYWHPILTPSAA